MLELRIRGPIEPEQLPGLLARVCAALEPDGAHAVLCEVSGVPADAGSVDALARLALAARRRGFQLRLCGVRDELRELVEFMGLADALPADPPRPAAPEGRTAGTGSRLRGRT
jgi:ABC-type transporter Mla MlaB component